MAEPDTFLREVDEAIGDPKAVEEFVSMTLNNVLGVQVTRCLLELILRNLVFQPDDFIVNDV